MAEFVPVEPFDLVIFGGTGDLSERKLLPALYHRDKDCQFTDDSRIVCASRSELDQESFIAFVRKALDTYLKEGEFDQAVWTRFSARLSYNQLDVTSDEGWSGLKDKLGQGENRIRVYYLAMLPSLFGATAKQIHQTGLINKNSRVVLEKPVGTNLSTAREINAAVDLVFNEDQIYRIDHYLGKETVQNLSALRFANSLFEPLWGHSNIDHVQITVAENMGVGNRAQFYNNTGALRDMVQNHILQLLCLVAMEPPLSMNHNDIRAEKIKVLHSLRQIDASNVEQVTVRGQYAKGAVDGEAVRGFTEEADDVSASDTETFVAIRANVDNWCWSGTPFYLRTGKRLTEKVSEIVIQFNPVSHSIFDQEAGDLHANRLTIRVQPNEGVTLSMMTKKPGPGGFQLRSLPLELSFTETYPVRYPDAYERLLMEVLRGNPALFMHRDEVEGAWRWVDQIIDGWKTTGQKASKYVAGSWGPTEAALLLDRDRRHWHEPEVDYDD